MGGKKKYAAWVVVVVSVQRHDVIKERLLNVYTLYGNMGSHNNKKIVIGVMTHSLSESLMKIKISPTIIFFTGMTVRIVIKSYFNRLY